MGSSSASVYIVVLDKSYPNCAVAEDRRLLGMKNGGIDDATTGWGDTHLPTISSYKLENIYNADEFGLFYQALPSKSMYLKSEQCSGGKHFKLSHCDKLPMLGLMCFLKPH